MKLYNTLTKQIEDFKPLKPNEVRIYSCGPTVYDHAHIGNLSAYIFADILRRVLHVSGYKVKHAMNYTDVDDKTIRRSRERYSKLPPKAALQKLTDEYKQLFLADMTAVGNDTNALALVSAVDSLEDMRRLITELHRKGFAYIADDGVYFSIEKYKASGKKYGQLLELSTQNTSQSRINNDEYDKESVHDFALWKKQKEGEPSWEFILDNQNLTGRPGWHIECSAMSQVQMGQPFDIHTGGVDLIFPHHENEIAQSTAGQQSPVMSQFFAHNEHVLVNGRKMAKSAHNFYTLEDVIKKGYDPLAFRLLVLQSHYRSQSNFSWQNLEAAQNRLKNLQAMADLRWQIRENTTRLTYYDTYAEAVFKHMTEDLSSPMALTILSGVADDLDEVVDSNSNDEFLDLLQTIDNLFGLRLLTSNDISDEQKQLVAEREKARASEDWAKSDQLRDKLKVQGIDVRDTDHGQVWSRL